MRKADIIKLVQDSEADNSLKKMVISYIEIAYQAGRDEGFAEGMKAGNQITSGVFSMLFDPKKGK